MTTIRDATETDLPHILQIRALPAAVIERAEARETHAMVAGIEAGNAVSLAMHRRAGFEAAGLLLREVGGKFGSWLDPLFVRKLLPGPTRQNG